MDEKNYNHMPKKAVFIIAQNNFRDEELFDTQQVLENRGIETVVASRTTDMALGKLGAEVIPDLSLADIDVDDFDAIIFIGGRGAASYFEDQTVWKLARDFAVRGKVVAAICIAPSILANAGILMGNRVTAFPTEEENLRSKGAEYTGMPVEVDGKIITGRDPEAAEEFGEKIAWELEE
jgi:protease I